MITLFNYWHYIVLFISFLVFGLGVAYAFTQSDLKSRVPIIFSFFIISSIIGGFGLFGVDKYTKVAKIHRLSSKRILEKEKMLFMGIVTNDGKHEIGEVVLEIKLVNKGLSGGSLKAGAFFEPSSISRFFSHSSNGFFKPQQIVQEFVIAKNLKPDESEEFAVYMDYPPYFSGSTEYTTIYAH